MKVLPLPARIGIAATVVLGIGVFALSDRAAQSEGAGGSVGSVAGCKGAMLDAYRSRTKLTERPAECVGVSDQDLKHIVGEILIEESGR